jgi:hypothetical protein
MYLVGRQLGFLLAAKETQSPDYTAFDISNENIVAYINWKILILWILPSNVYHSDQTIVFYSMEATYTWAEGCTRKVSVQGANSLTCLTVIFFANVVG